MEAQQILLFRLNEEADSLSLDRNSTDTAIEVKWRSSTQALSIENYNFRILDLKFGTGWCICLGFLFSQS